MDAPFLSLFLTGATSIANERTGQAERGRRKGRRPWIETERVGGKGDTVEAEKQRAAELSENLRDSERQGGKMKTGER